MKDVESVRKNMTIEEAIKTIKIAISEVEWEYPMDYACAFEMAIEALELKMALEDGEIMPPCR